MRAVCVCAIIGVMACVQPAVTGEQETKKDSFRVITIPDREYGYSNFESTVIRSKTELDSFIEKVSGKGTRGWNNRKDFVDGIITAAVDFENEVLVLVRHTEGSGSVRVALKTTMVKGETLVCTIERKVPEDCTKDMAYYCFALAVSKSVVQEVEMSIVLPIVGKEGANKPDGQRAAELNGLRMDVKFAGFQERGSPRFMVKFSNISNKMFILRIETLYGLGAVAWNVDSNERWRATSRLDMAMPRAKDIELKPGESYEVEKDLPPLAGHFYENIGEDGKLTGKPTVKELPPGKYQVWIDFKVTQEFMGDETKPIWKGVITSLPKEIFVPGSASKK